MQTEEPVDAGGPEDAQASESETAAEGEIAAGDTSGGEAVATEIQPFFDATPNVLWTTFGGVAAIFLIVIFLIMRMRAGPAIARAKQNTKTDFFEPAGEDAEITFDDEAPLTRQKANQGDLESDGEAEVIIEETPHDSEPEEAQENTPPPRKQGAFAGLFGKKRNAEPAVVEEQDEAAQPDAANPLRTHPLASERQAAMSEDSPFAEAAEDQREWAPSSEFDEAEERRIALVEAEAARREAELEAERARYQAEEEFRRIEESRRVAEERQADFERRKLAAAVDQRGEALSEYERSLSERASALEMRSQEMQRGIADEIQARFAALAEKLDYKLDQMAQMQAAGAAPATDAGAEDARFAAVTEMISRRIADQRDAINASLTALSARIDQIAGAQQDVGGLRSEIATLNRTLGERSNGPHAPAVQLTDIVRNALPPDAYEMRAMLPNNRRADCLIKLAHPPGPIAVDARFPVEAFHNLRAPGPGGEEAADNEFRRTALRHIVDIAERLIVPGTTAESALMFIPSESMYTELHVRFPDVVQDSYRARVWIVSPTTLMATLHTLRAVLRDAQTRTSQRVGTLEEGLNKAPASPPAPMLSTSLSWQGGLSNPERARSQPITSDDDEGPDLWEDNHTETGKQGEADESDEPGKQAPFPLR